MEDKKVITGTMMTRWLGILTLVAIPTLFLIAFFRTDYSILEFLREVNWFVYLAGIVAGIILCLVSKKTD